MESKRVKGDNESHTLWEDRISQLPDPLIHYIFSFIPTFYLVRMSRLSKRWRHMWVSTPFLYFKDFDNHITLNKKVRNIRDTVLKFASDCLQHRKLCVQIPDMSITSFKFKTSYNCGNSVNKTRRIDDWLHLAFQSKVKELDLHVENYYLPWFFLNGSLLTVLKLGFLKLYFPFLSTFPSLKVLYLWYVKFDNKSLQNLISGCPIIEELHFSGRSLEGDIDFAVSGTIRNLSLLSEFTGRWLDNQISRLPVLERLTLDCNKLEHIGICSHSLKYLSYRSYHCSGAKLKTPNLVFLHFECVSWSTISFEAPNLLEANLRIAARDTDITSYMNLVHLLSNLNSVKKMMLNIWVEEILIFPEGIRNKCPSPLPNLNHVKVNIFKNSSAKIEALLDSLIWCAPSLDTLDINGEREWT